MNEVLIDTHTLLWSVDDVAALSPAAEDCLRSEALKYVSHASVWEMSIKLGLGKLTLSVGLPQLVAMARSTGLQMLPIDLEHLYSVQTLPNHHRDPFDRLIVAQCRLRSLPIVSRDAIFDNYGLQRIW